MNTSTLKINLFHTQIAEEYGVYAAILLENINYWVEKNESSRHNFHDGAYWTYQSIEGFKKVFPFISRYQITRSLKALIDAGILAVGNYNRTPFDRTKWYTLTEKGKSAIQMSKNALSDDEDSIAQEPEVDSFGDEEKMSWGQTPNLQVENQIAGNATASQSENQMSQRTEVRIAEIEQPRPTITHHVSIHRNLPLTCPTEANENPNEQKFQQDFAQFWEAYPRKVGRMDAEEAFQLVYPTAPIGLLLKAVEQQKQSQVWQDAIETKDLRFIPYPANWLRKERWKDTISAPEKQTQITTPRRRKFKTIRDENGCWIDILLPE